MSRSQVLLPFFTLAGASLQLHESQGYLEVHKCRFLGENGF